MQVYTYSNLCYGITIFYYNKLCYTVNLYGFSGQFIFFKGEKKTLQTKQNQPIPQYMLNLRQHWK